MVNFSGPNITIILQFVGLALNPVMFPFEIFQLSLEQKRFPVYLSSYEWKNCSQLLPVLGCVSFEK